VELKVFMTEGMPGANIDEASGETKVIAETNPITTTFLHNAQF